MDEWSNSFLETARSYSLQNRVPISGSIELTFRCNYNCVHCYVNLPSGDKVAKARELTTNEWKRIVEEIAQAGCFHLLISGGELMLRPDWQEIYLHAKRQGILPSLYTNGSTITTEVVDFLSEYPPEHVEITLYGATRETYERVTRLPGSFDKALRGINLLIERGIPLKLKSVALRSNFHEMNQMKHFTENLGLKFKYDPLINIRIDGQSYPIAERLTPAELVALDIETEADEMLIEICTGANGVPRGEETFVCGAGRIGFAIDPFGIVSTCMIVRKPSVDLRQHSFDYAWNVIFKQAVETKRSGTQRCDHCDINGSCQQCAGWSMLEHDDFETPVDWMCDVTHARNEVFNQNYQPKPGKRVILLSPLVKN